MARAQVKEGVIRGCPVCSTPVDEAHLALRDLVYI